MTFYFDGLPAELQSKIFACCSKEDWKNIALVNKHCCQLIRPSIWARVTKCWHTLETPSDIEKYKDYLSYTTSIQFKDSRLVSQRNLEPLRQGYKNFLFYEILHHCRSANVRQLEFSDFIVASGLQLASKKLPMVGKIVLDCIQEEGWKAAFNFYCLKELYIFECNIEDEDFSGIRNIKGLKELSVRRCSRLKGSFFAHVSQIALGLDTFTFEDIDDNVPGKYFTNLLKNLDSVRKLSLVSTLVEDSFFIQLIRTPPQITHLSLQFSNKIGYEGFRAISSISSLEVLDLYECDNIYDDGFEHLYRLPSLRWLNIGCVENITDLGLLYISKVKMLQYLDIGFSRSVTDQGIVHLKNLDSLRFLDMRHCEELTDNTLEFISKNLKKLEYIHISCEMFTVIGLNHLLALKELRDIEYDGGIISEADIESFIAKLKNR